MTGLGGSNPVRSSEEAGETKNEKGPETVEAPPAWPTARRSEPGADLNHLPDGCSSASP
jgi:hypothetical protein